MEAFLRAAPTPAKKRKGAEKREEGGEDTQIKVLTKSMQILFGEMRNVTSRVGQVLITPADHALTKKLTQAKEQYLGSQPERTAGAAGQPHPWGAPRNFNTAILFGITIAMYQSDKTLTEDAVKIWGHDRLELLVKNMLRCVNDAFDSKNFTVLDPLCNFFRFKVAKSGQGVTEITGGTGLVYTDELRKYDLNALPLQDLWGMLLMPYSKFIVRGPAPKGRLERQVIKLVASQNSKH